MGADNSGLSENLIFNNAGGGTQHPDFAFTIDRDIYLLVTANGVEEIDSYNFKPSSGSHKIYINNQTGWDALGLYAWGEGLPELFGEWPGLTTYTSETIDGVTYQVFTYEGSGQEYHLILNNAGAGSQVDGPAITAGSDFFFTVTASEWKAQSVKARR